MDEDLKKYFFNRGYWEGFFTGFTIAFILIPTVIKLYDK
jgi:hypothetical protein